MMRGGYRFFSFRVRGRVKACFVLFVGVGGAVSQGDKNRGLLLLYQVAYPKTSMSFYKKESPHGRGCTLWDKGF